MIITKIRLQEENPMATSTASWPLPSCDLDLDSSAGGNGYLIKASAGFGPPNLTAVVEGFDATGIPIFGSISDKRDLALRIGLNPSRDQSFSELRDDLYKFLGRSVYVSLMDGATVIGQTKGYIRQFDTGIFASQPEVQMTIECNDGEFSSPFPVDIPFADLETDQPIIVYDPGTAPTGMDLVFNVTAVDESGFTIFNHARMWHAGTGEVDNQFIVDFEFLQDDIVTISTHPKDKRLTVFRDPDTIDLAGFINAGAVWPKLYSGVNVFEWTLNSDWMEWVSATYTPRYWGV